ncbi:hypothetical protein DRP05_06800 [Archaeoglobales archaeon]|nr:MAG: hypothetical protein DRP05_06800 [Archaeoglobales archaeon]
MKKYRPIDEVAERFVDGVRIGKEKYYKKMYGNEIKKTAFVGDETWCVDKFIENRVIPGEYKKDYQITLKGYSLYSSIPIENRKIDLVIHGYDNITYICEFKSKFNADTIAKAIGQLIIYEELFIKKFFNVKTKKVAIFCDPDFNIECGGIIGDNIKRKKEISHEFAKIMQKYGIMLYIYLDGCFTKVKPMKSESVQNFLNKFM